MTLLSRAMRALVPMISIALLALAAARPAEAAPSWLEPVDLGQSDHPSYHDIEMTPGGEVLALWREGTIDDYVVRAVERPAGGSLSPPRELVAAGDIVENINLDLNEDGDAIAVWRRRDGDGGSLRLQYSVREAGGEFSIGQFGSPNGADVAQPDVALEDDGDAIVVWRRAPVPGDGYVRFATRPAGGQFGPVGSVVDESGRSPQVELDGAGNATAIWAREAAPAVIRVASRPPGGSFSTATTLSNVVFAISAAPALAVNHDGAAIAAWRREVSGDDRIEVRLREPGGAFKATQQISPDGADSGFPQVAIDDQGEVIVAWDNDTADTIEAAVGSVAGGLGAPETLSGPDAFGHSLAMTDEGRAAVAWSEGTDPVYRVYATVRPPGGEFGAAAPVSNAEDQGLGPQVALDEEGNGVVAWRHRTEPGIFASERIRLAGYDAVPPQLTSVGFPGSDLVGTQLGFSASTFDVWGPVDTSWEFGDGTGASGESVSHAYRRAGDFQARVTATDAAGNASTAQAATVTAIDDRVRIRILGRRVPLNRRGIARLRLRCPASERSSPCRGRVVVRTQRRLRVGRKRRRIVLTRGRFRIPAGRTRVVRMRLGRRKARLVRRNRRARRVVSLAGVRDGSGNRSRARKPMRVVPLRRGGKRNGSRR